MSEKQVPWTWEVGAAYRTRGGKKVWLKSLNQKTARCETNESEFKVYVNTGQIYEKFTHPLDIVGLWEDALKHGAAEGEPCNRHGCAGVIGYHHECRCAAINAPCSACENANLTCSYCEWEHGADADGHDYAGAHARDINTPDNRRPRVSLRTDAQIAHDRAVLRLRQHKLARWGRAEHVRWEEEL